MNEKPQLSCKLKGFVPASQSQLAELVELKRQSTDTNWEDAAESLLDELGMPSYEFLSHTYAAELIGKYHKTA